METVRKNIITAILFTALVAGCRNIDNDADAKPDVGVYSNGTILDVKIIGVSFYDASGNKLESDGNWIHIGADTKITVTYSGAADQIDYIFTPAGTETYNLQEIIGNSFVGASDAKAEFIWTPTDSQSLGYINVSINLGRYSVRSDYINVIYEP